MGGNKGRKLEYIMADVLRLQKRKVVTYGGLQSNHARMTAAACAALGLEAHLFFFERRPRKLEGNLLLNELLGARMRFIPFGGGGDASMTIEFTNRLVRLASAILVGPGAYFVPVGGHSVIGCMGYVEAACELHEQLSAQGVNPERVTVVTAVGSGGTLAGLMAGFALLDSPVKLLGIDVGKLWKTFPASLARLAGKLCATLDSPRTFRSGDVPMIEGAYVGPGYATLTPEAAVAIRILAQSEGIVLDPIYTGKAFAGLLDMLGDFSADEDIVFLHSGGTPGLWALADQIVDDTGVMK
jgi:1-aminocyclopropane-1-carboxylate deaminase/D-cysteine desulfhydrase-like pyridoxal-dependent ACC family enzyme